MKGNRSREKGEDNVKTPGAESRGDEIEQKENLI